VWTVRTVNHNHNLTKVLSVNNSAFDLLDTLRGLDVEVSVEGDDLDIDAPVGVMTPDLIELVRNAKPGLLTILDLSDTLPEIFGEVHSARRVLCSVCGHSNFSPRLDGRVWVCATCH
jgi:hypothetical protein